MTHTQKPRLILGSSSPRRLQLLAQIGVTPDIVQPADINEDPIKRELPEPYVMRIAAAKNDALAAQFPNDFILTADTTVCVGTRIIGKAENRAEAEKIARLLSGRSHRILTAVVLRAPDGKISKRLSDTRVKVRRLTDDDITAHLDTNEWEGCAGAYKFQGGFAKFIAHVNGTPSGIIGLPLFETAQMLKGLGWDQGL